MKPITSPPNLKLFFLNRLRFCWTKWWRAPFIVAPTPSQWKQVSLKSFATGADFAFCIFTASEKVLRFFVVRVCCSLVSNIMSKLMCADVSRSLNLKDCTMTRKKKGIVNSEPLQCWDRASGKCQQVRTWCSHKAYFISPHSPLSAVQLRAAGN